MRNSIIKSTACSIAALVVFISTAFQSQADTYIDPYLSFEGPPESSIVISCVTDPAEEVEIKIYYNGNQVGSAYLGDYIHHHAQFTNLTSERTYTYSVETTGSSNIDYDGSFTTAKEELDANDALVIYGDSKGSYSYDEQNGFELVYHEHDDVVHAIMNYPSVENPDPPLFILNVGDLTDDHRVINTWKNDFFDDLLYYDAINTRPILCCLGNHDCQYSNPSDRYTQNGNSVCLDTACYDILYEFPTNNYSNSELFYSFDYGQIHFTILNSQAWNDGVYEWWSDDYLSDEFQLNWLEQDLAGTDKPYRIVLYHIPGSDGFVTGYELNTLHEQIFKKYHIQAVFRGHNHYYYHVELEGIHYVNTGGGGDDLHSGGPLGNVMEHHYMRLEYQSGHIDVKPLDIDNNILTYESVLLNFTIYPSYLLSGSLSGTLEAGDYYVVDDISVASGNTLTIEPGANIYFDDDFEFHVYGTLIAEGTGEEDDITFAATPGSGANWSGIILHEPASENSIFEYCRISDCQLGVAAIRSNTEISNCWITDVVNGIFVHDCRFTMTETKVECSGFGLLDNQYDNFITIINCSFIGDESDATGIEINTGDFKLYGHHGITSTVSGFAIGVECNDAKVLLAITGGRRCKIDNNYEYGVELYNCEGTSLFYATDFMENGVVYASDPCGGLHLYDTSPHIIQCYFEDNFGDAITSDQTSSPIVGNSGNNTMGNEFEDNAPRTGCSDEDAISYEDGDSYPIFNNRYNNFYKGEDIYDYYIRNETQSTRRYIKYNFWDGTTPTYEDFYPASENPVIYDFLPISGTEPNPIGSSPESGKRGGWDSDGLEEGIALELEGEFEEAVAVYQEFIAETEDEIKQQIAMRRVLLASQSGSLTLSGLGSYYQSVGNASLNQSIINAASNLQIEVKMAMGDYEGAVLAYEEVLLGSPAFEDSIYAVIDAGWAYLMMEDSISIQPSSFNPQIPSLMPKSMAEYKQLRKELLSELRNYRSIRRMAGEGVEGVSGVLPMEFTLHQNHPNPFNPVTHIRYDLPEICDVRIEIFNIMGRKVCTLVEGIEPAGYRSSTWRGVGDDGKPLASGIYIYRLTAEGHDSETKFIRSAKMLLLK